MDFWIPWGANHREMKPPLYCDLFNTWFFCRIESEWVMEGIMRCDTSYLDFWIHHIVSKCNAFPRISVRSEYGDGIRRRAMKI